MKKIVLNLVCFFALMACHSQGNELNNKVALAIKKSAGYFSALGTNIDRRDVVMILFILQEHFNYPMNLPSVNKFKENDPGLNESYFKLYDTYFEGRDSPLYPDSTVIKYLSSNTRSLDGLTSWSMFCNKYPLPEDYLILLNENAGKGGYEMTHAALQLGNVMQLDCVISKNESQKLRVRLLKALTAQLNSIPTIEYSEDLKYECMAMLYYLKGDDLVTEAQIRFIVENQLSNGGWSPSAKANNQANIHTSVLALWVLLEYYSRNN